MGFVLTKKDIIALNQKFDKGLFHNEPSLDFALDFAQSNNDWTRALAFVVRAILIDHVFEEGNKRTTALLIEAYIEFENHQVYPDRVVKLIKRIILRNTISIKKIEEMIKDAIQ
jgi:prophage maintenance system killer protein